MTDMQQGKWAGGFKVEILNTFTKGIGVGILIYKYRYSLGRYHQ